MFSFPVRNLVLSNFGLAIKTFPGKVFILNESAIWLFNKELHNTQIHCLISLSRTCRPCGFTMTISSRGHRRLIYIVKRNTKTDGMGPFKVPFKSPQDEAA